MKIKYLMICVAMIIALLVSCFIAPPAFAFAAEPSDAHFFVRYDSTIPDDSNVAECPPSQYFPIGEVASSYHYGDNQSDYSSVDGQVYARAVQVEGAEALITKGNINLYNTFGVDKDTLVPFFDTIYSNLVNPYEPRKTVISWSILQAMGTKWQEQYDLGNIDVVWYVIKDQGHHVNVDGCLYWTKSGETTSIGDVDDNGNPQDPYYKNNPIIKPADPMDPGYAVDPQPDGILPTDPMDPDFSVDYESDTKIDDNVDNGYLIDDEVVETKSSQSKDEPPTIESIDKSETDIETPIGEVKIIQEDTPQMPDTNDGIRGIIESLTCIAVLSAAIGILAHKNKQNSK